MHMWSNELGVLGGNGIVAAQLPIAAGVALAAQYLGKDTVTACFFGDGAVDEGAFHESLNLAAIWKLPVIYICENNQYSMGMAVEKAWAVDSLLPRADAHNIPGEVVDGMLSWLSSRQRSVPPNVHALVKAPRCWKLKHIVFGDTQWPILLTTARARRNTIGAARVTPSVSSRRCSWITA
jgi:deoxyxylulose-5-phosphate synthase